MDLTPEERQRIYAEEKARLEAQHQIRHENWTFGRYLVVCCLGFLALLVLGGIISSLSEKKSPPEPGSDKFGAYFYSEKFVEERLRAPSTAKFCDFKEARVSVDGGDSYTVVGWVDAQNGFGAMLRNNFVCKLHKTGNSWYLDDVTLVPR
jgi:hypothetical protein